MKYLSRVFLVVTAGLALNALLVQADELVLPLPSVSSQELNQQRGMADVEMNYQLNDSEQNALLQNNIISNSVTGDNAISDSAFSGMSGISTIIQNTGNQVIIQDTTMVNVMFGQ